MPTLLTPNFSRIARYAFAVVVIIIAALLREILWPVLGAGVPFILFYPAVALAAWFGGFWPGVLSTVLGGLTAWYIFMPPSFSWMVLDPSSASQLIVFLLASLFICLLAESLHEATRQARQSEIKEREQHEQYRVTLGSIGDAVIATDAKGRVTFMNAVAESLTGWTYQNASGRPLDEVFKVLHEESRQPVSNPALQALQKGFVVGLANHSVLIAKDGTERAIDDSAAPIQTAETGITGAVLVFRDITERRAAQRELVESRERFRITLESIGDAVIATDAEGRVSFVNPVAQKLLGSGTEQIVGRSLRDVFNIVNEITREPVENPVERVLRDSKIVGLANHTLLVRPDGIEIPIDDSAAPIQDGEGSIVGVVLVFRDVSEQRRAEKAHATLAAIIESSDDAIVSKDLNGRIMTWNLGAERLFGYREDEAIGQPITLIIPPERIHEEAEILRRIRNGERVDHYETVRVRKDGTPAEISLTVSPVRGADGTIIGASKIARDITERRAMERQLREADRQKDNFIAIVAHELRNPLSPIQNTIKVLQLERSADRELQHYCDLIEKEIMQINRLLGDLLDSSRITQGKLSLQKEHTNLVTAINRAIEATRSIVAQAGHRVVVDFPSEPLTVQADLMRLTQVFSNLLNNAAKFTDSEGDIRVTAERQGNQAVVRVKDSGIGIAPELMPKIFDMFVQGETVTERTHGGLGLGLTLARDIVQLHGGSIEAKSDGLGKGSEFVVALPLSVPPQPLEYGRSATAQIAAATVPRRIVIVDDSKNQVLSLERLFKRMGHEVRVAYDAAGAVRVMEEFLPDFALIDIGLPGVNGYDLARQLRDRPQFRSVTLIAQTGWGREEDRNEARDAGFDHHLVKPIDHQRLAEILANPSSPRPS
jgi:PAS domain S-box-containing protein